MDKDLLIVIGLMAVMLGIGVKIIMDAKVPQNQRKAKQEKAQRKQYEFLSSFFLSQGQILKISSRLSALSVYSRRDMQLLSIKYYMFSTGISGGLIIASLFLFKDTVSTLICIAFGLLLNNILVDKQIDKVNLQIYKALRISLASIKQEYMKLGSVPEAIAEAEIHYLLRKPMEEIHSILTNANGELKLQEFYESSPFRSLQTFAGICYNINNSGDDKDAHGQSNFMDSLTMLTTDVNSEIERLMHIRASFRGVDILPFIPIMAVNFLESYFIGIMPGTALIYNGVLGYILRVITLMTCILCYCTISSMNSTAPIKEDDRSPLSRTLLKNPDFKQFIFNITPKNSQTPWPKCLVRVPVIGQLITRLAKMNKTKQKMEYKLRMALSRKGLDHIYTEKVVYSSVAFVVALLVCISTVSLGRDFTINSTQQLSLVATDEMNTYSKEQILAFDFAYFERDHEWSQDEGISMCKSMMPGLTDLQALDQVKRIMDKEAALKMAYFHWYYILACIAVSIIAWFGPDIQLTIRRFLVENEAEDDFLQLQTLIAIIMNTEADTLDALYQMCQHSRIHKNMLLYCYHGFPSDPMKELTRLQTKTPLIDFRRFIGTLALTVSDLSLKEAFNDLKMERQHILEMRKISMYATINRKRSICGKLAMVPIGVFVVAELLIPLGYLGIKEFTSALSSMGSM